MIYSIEASREAIRVGKTTLPSIVKQFLDRIEEHQELNAFLEVFGEEAQERAEKIQKKMSSGSAGPLAGAVIGIKDNISFKGHKLGASSKILEGFEAIYDSTVVERLINADAIIIGRLNCDEFAMGSSNENSAFGRVIHPQMKDRVSGGSSGGSAAAVAANLCHVALGTDTGGSIRQPASFCGIYGVKPTYGRVSRHGIIAFASSFDQVGPLSNNLEDAALILGVIAGKDDFDATASDREVENYLQKDGPELKSIAVIKGLAEQSGLEEGLRREYNKQLELLKSSGVKINEVSFDYLDYVVPCYYMLTTAEASSNLGRYTGVLYGNRDGEAGSLEETYIKSRSHGFGQEVKRRIMLGTFVLSEGYYDAYYSKAQKVRRLLRDKARQILQENDALLTPTTPDVAFVAGTKNEDPIQMYLSDIFTVLANLTGMPAISIPVGSNEDGLPYGMQLMTPDFTESKMFSYASQLDSLNKIKS